MNARRKATRDGARVRVFLGEPALTESLAQDAIDELTAADARDLDLEVVRLPIDPIERVREALDQVGMFSLGRCVVVRGAIDDAETAEKLLGYLEAGFSPDAALVIVTSKVDGRSRLFRWLRQNGRVEDLRIERKWDGRVADATELAPFVRGRFVDNGFPAPPSPEIEWIVSRAGSDIAHLGHEIDKLCLSIDPPRPVRREDLERGFLDMAGAWIFDFMDALLEGRAAAAHTTVTRLLADGEPPLRLVAALATRSADFLLAAAVARSLGLPAPPSAPAAFVKSLYPTLPDGVRRRFASPFRAYHVFRVAQARGYRWLRRFHGSILQLDLDLKSGTGQARHLIAQFIDASTMVRAG
jgi:DNA polymerase III delta subunit